MDATLGTGEAEKIINSANTFSVIQCDATHFLNSGNNSCDSYTFSGKSYCEYFNSNADECQRCEQIYDFDSNTCITKDASFMCLEGTKQNCTKCAENRFFDSSTKYCQLIPNSELTTNCKFYDSSKICIECNTTHRLK